jgi:hypothetical protein
MVKLKPEQLQYICREQFETGIPIFRNPYKSPEQIENVIPTLRRLMLDHEIPREEHIAILRNLPRRFTAPDELSFYLGFGDVLLRKEDGIMGKNAERVSTEEFMNRLVTGTIDQREGEFGHIAASRFLLNSYIQLSHPSVLVTHGEVESNGGIYDIWAKKFPSSRGVEPVSEEILYGNYGKMNAAEVMESFLGMVSGEKKRLPEDVRRDLNSRLR